MNSLFGSLLAIMIFLFLGASVVTYENQSMDTAIQRNAAYQTAQEQIQFAWAADQYLTANSPRSGSTITVSQLQSAGYLPSGYLQPSGTNAFGQTPVAYVGSNNTALAIYNQGPAPADLQNIGVGENPQTQEGFALQIAAKGAAMAETFPGLVAIAVSANAAQTPFQGYATNAIGKSFPNYAPVSVPSMGVLINVLPH